MAITIQAKPAQKAAKKAKDTKKAGAKSKKKKKKKKGPWDGTVVGTTEKGGKTYKAGKTKGRVFP